MMGSKAAISCFWWARSQDGGRAVFYVKPFFLIFSLFIFLPNWFYPLWNISDLFCSYFYALILQNLSRIQPSLLVHIWGLLGTRNKKGDGEGPIDSPFFLRILSNKKGAIVDKKQRETINGSRRRKLTPTLIESAQKVVGRSSMKR